MHETVREDDLIFDVGMHNGEDTEFYLSRGFRVVGVEANPDLVRGLEKKFAAEIADGRVTIVPKAIAREAGTLEMAVSDVSIWGTFDENLIERMGSKGIDVRRVPVETVRFADILREFGMPYYLKIDIEGFDMLCVEALHEFASRPKYVSLESYVTSAVTSVAKGFDELAHLWVLGYRGFKYVDQQKLPGMSGTRLDIEGTPVVYQHVNEMASGPFGEESLGDWREIGPTVTQMLKLVAYQNTLGFGGKHSRMLPFRAFRRTKQMLTGIAHHWYDLHARLGD